MGAAAKGLAGLEFLLFDGTEDHQAILDSMAIGQRAGRRRAYDRYAAAELAGIAQTVAGTWSQSYAQEFMNGDVNSGISDLINSLLKTDLFSAVSITVTFTDTDWKFGKRSESQSAFVGRRKTTALRDRCAVSSIHCQKSDEEKTRVSQPCFGYASTTLTSDL